MNGKDCLLACAEISIFWGPLEERNLLRQSLMAGLWHGFLALGGFSEIQSEIPSEEFHHHQFGEAYVAN